MKISVVFVLLSLGASSIHTGHVWLEPNRFQFSAGDTAVVAFKIGENLNGEGWTIQSDRIVRMEHHTAAGMTNIKNSMADHAIDLLKVPLTQPGTHLVVMETEIELADAGQPPAEKGIRVLSTHTKLILHAGTQMDEIYKKTCNLPMEIIPNKNPVTLKKGERVGFKILLEGKPFFGAKVKILNRYNHRISVQNIFTQQDGMVETYISNPGIWMVMVETTISAENSQERSRGYQANLVFGVQ